MEALKLGDGMLTRKHLEILARAFYGLPLAGYPRYSIDYLKVFGFLTNHLQVTSSGLEALKHGRT